MNSSLVALLATVLVGMSSAQAAVLNHYSDAASWSAAVSHKTTVTIPDLPSPGYLYLDNSVTLDGVTFSTNPTANSYFFQIGTEFEAEEPVLAPILSVRTLEQGTFGGMLITFAAPVNAFSLNFGTFDGQAVAFTLSTGDQFSRSTIGGSYAVPEFVGITSSTYFNTVLVSSIDEVFHVNDLNFSSVVPEPSTWAMLLLGFAGVAWMGFRRSRRGLRAAGSSVD
jgi:hypothetical protein